MYDNELIKELEERINFPKKGKVSKKEYDVWGFPPEVLITRWKFNEWDYYNPKAHLPTQARGLFTLEDKILLRGYNKFFNTGETKATAMDKLESETTGPYYATVKENGYLVLIGALDGKLVITSKNSSGPSSTNEVGNNHSFVAREWVLKLLKKANKTEEEFAKLLADNDWTAVGEVCDDNFEEHVLQYPQEDSGIYLNGLNKNSRHFITESPSVVKNVATDFGFQITDYVEFASMEELMRFLETSSLTGKWGDREVEGFVIRCKRRERGFDDRVDFFWKYKFEEPYFMYREWREVVKTYLNKSINAAYMRAKRSKHTESCLRFLRYASQYLTKHPELKSEIIDHSRGIFEIRNHMYIQMKEDEGLTEQMLLELDLNTPKYLLVTVATLGCGKSTVSESVSSLMKGKWAHEQSDNIKDKQKGKFFRLVGMVFDDFLEHDVAILDRNNSMQSERKQLFDFIDDETVARGSNTKVICLNFLPNGVTEESKQVTRQNVINRGDNHQNIQVSSMGVNGVEGLISNFERRFDQVRPETEPDSNFDLIIDLEPGQSEQNVRRIFETLRKQQWPQLDVPDFSDSEIRNAVDVIRNKPQEFPLMKPASAKKKQKQSPNNSGKPKEKGNNNRKQPERRTTKYFGLLVDESSQRKLLELANSMGAPLNTINVQARFHLTLAHVNSHKKEFDEFCAKYKDAVNQPHPPTLVGAKSRAKITALAWNDTPGVMAFRAEADSCANKYGHITVGTKTDVPPMVARDLFEPDAQHVTILSLPTPIILDNMEIFASP